MKRVVIIWRDNEDYSRTVTEWLHDFEHRTGKQLESLSPDEGDGLSLCKAYDVVEYPSIIVLGDSGEVRQMWRGASMPRMDEVAYYLLEN